MSNESENQIATLIESELEEITTIAKYATVQKKELE